MTGLTRYDVTIDPMTIQLVSRTKVITITEFMLNCILSYIILIR